MNHNEAVYKGQSGRYVCPCGWTGKRFQEDVVYVGFERHYRCPKCARDLIAPFDVE